MGTLIDARNPTNHARPGNPLFKPFNSIFVETWKIAPATEQVHQQFYVPTPSPPDPDFYSFLGLDPEIVHPLIGEYETDIFNYVAGNGNEVLIVLGTVGTGKTTLVKNFDLLCRKHASSKVITILVNFNTQRSAFERLLSTSGESVLQLAATRYLTDRILSRVSDLVDPHGDDFWEYAWGHADAFARFRVRSTIEQELYTSDSEWRRARQLEFRDSPEYLTTLLRYISRTLKMPVVIFCDNVDPLPGSTCEAILWAAESVCNTGGAKVVATMRPNVYRAIGHRIDALNNIRLRLKPSSLLEILRRRTDFNRKKIDDASKDSRLQVMLKTYGLQGKDAVELFDAMASAFLSPDIADEIDRLSNNNRRLGFDILIQYLKSSYIHTDAMLNKMRHLFRNPAKVELDVPTHVLVQAAVAQNYDTHFPLENKLPCIANIWCDASFERPLGYFAQLMLLSFVSNQPEEVSCATIVEAMSPIVDLFTDGGHSKSIIHRLFERAITCLCLESPDVLVIDRGSGVPPGGRLVMTPLGRHILRRMAFELEYFSYIKDSIEFGADRPNAASAIDEPSFHGRFKESCRMAEWLVAQETDMWEKLSKDRGALRRFVNDFAARDVDGQLLPFTSGFLAPFQRLIREQPHRILADETARFQVLERSIRAAEVRLRDLGK